MGEVAEAVVVVGAEEVVVAEEVATIITTITMMDRKTITSLLQIHRQTGNLMESFSCQNRYVNYPKKFSLLMD